MSAGPTEAFGPYLVYEQLGSGGMARVDRAELTGIEGFHRTVALKRMLPHVATDEDMVKAFVREARLASHLRHGNVAQTYEFGKVDDVYFIAMELVTGPTLRAILKHCAQTTGPMPVPVALNILNQICDALDYAHNLCDEAGQPLGIIHRDVSPSNIIVDEAGVTKLIDFGIAKASAAGMQTMSGTIKGKFGYMAPEYILGRIDARADLFAVGVIAHELLTNRPLFSVADDMETLRRVRAMPLQPPSRTNPHVPPEIDDVVMTALARDPNQRWQHATALRTALTTLTRRLGLVCTNPQVVTWIAWAFEQTKPHGTHAADIPEDTDLAEPSLLLEPPTRSELLRPPAPDASSQMTMQMARAAPGASRPAPAGTPPRSLALQRAGESSEPHPPGAPGHRAPGAAYAAYEGLAQAPRTTDEIRTALIRPSTPRPESAAEPGGRARSMSEPPPGELDHNVTLLDGAAALRSRTAAQSAAPPPSGPTGPSVPVVTINRSAPPMPQLGVRASSPLPYPPALRPMPLPGQPPAQPSDRRSVPSGQLLAPPRAPSEAEPPRRSSVAVVVVLVLLAAGLAAALVYFALPHLT